MGTNYDVRQFSHLLHSLKHKLEQRVHERHIITGSDVSASIEQWIIKPR
jgi:hypothetical protein